MRGCRISRSRHWVAVLPLLIGGCLSLHSNQPQQQTYVLSLPASPTAASANLDANLNAGLNPNPGASPGDARPTGADAASVQVLLPGTAAGLGGDNIAVLRPGQRLDYYSGARWAENVPTMVQGLLIQALRRRGSFALVESDSGPFGAGYVLSVDLTHFEASYVGGPDEGGGGGGDEQALPTAHVELVCTLGRRASGNAVATLTVNSSVTAQANRMQAVVDAFQRAIAQALTQVAQQLTAPSTP